MKRANLIFLGIGVVVVLLLFLSLIPVREGGPTKLNSETAKMMSAENVVFSRVTPTTNTTTKTPAATKRETVQSSVKQTIKDSRLLDRSIKTKQIK